MKGKVVPVASEDSVSYKNRKNPSTYTENVIHTSNAFEEAAEHIITQRTLNRSWFFTGPAVSEKITQLGKLADQLQVAYKTQLDDIIAREPWTERNCVTDFKKILDEVLCRDEEEYNWTRIAMLLALAIRLAQHFHQNKASEQFVRQFAKCVGSCIQDKVNTWERPERWEILRNSSKESESSSNGLKYLIGAGASLASFFATVVNLGSASPVFLNRLKS